MSAKQRGQAIVEFALILPMLIVLLLGGADLLMALSAHQIISYAAEQTAQCVSLGLTLCGRTVCWHISTGTAEDWGGRFMPTEARSKTDIAAVSPNQNMPQTNRPSKAGTETFHVRSASNRRRSRTRVSNAR
jgi:TadE-like protein